MNYRVNLCLTRTLDHYDMVINAVSLKDISNEVVIFSHCFNKSCRHTKLCTTRPS